MTGKIGSILVILVLLQTSIRVQGSETCEQRAEKAVNVHKCCTMPSIAKIETLKAVVDDLIKNVDPTSSKFHCLFASKLFEALNLKDFDKATYKAYMPTIVQDPEWLTIYENVTNHCVDNLSKYEEFYGKIFKLPKEECDVRYTAFLDCVMGTAFVFCPAKSFTDSTECKGTRSFLTECYENDHAMDIYIKNQMKLPS
ncbi:hypothetical protein ACKWTF_013038 [Chironomus riparius]